MKKNTNKKDGNSSSVSELRMDVISEDWVIVAKGRTSKPSEFVKRGGRRRAVSRKRCVFCNLGNKEDQNKVTAMFCKGEQLFLHQRLSGRWDIAVIKNKFPAVSENVKGLDEHLEGGFYKKMNAFGFHEVVVLRDHQKRISQMKTETIKELFGAYQQRYLSLMNKTFVRHISIFHNSGPSAGASVEHPHSQIITTPLVDKDLRASSERARRYYESQNYCVYCKMIAWEKETRERVVFENEAFLALCPFASKTAFEVIITPKKHLSRFEKINEREAFALAEVFKTVFEKIDKTLNNPDFNFYLHTAPCDGQSHEYYHWHWTILPKTSLPAGFELGTLMDITTVPPEEAASYLRAL